MNVIARLHVVLGNTRPLPAHDPDVTAKSPAFAPLVPLKETRSLNADR
jgi:hypothetical protein